MTIKHRLTDSRLKEAKESRDIAEIQKENDIGRQSEDKFEKALKILIQRNPLFYDYSRAPKNGELDSLHIDYLVYLSNFLAVPFQVKSSLGGLKRHKKKYPHIYALIVKPRHSTEVLANIIEKAVYHFLKSPFVIKNRKK